MIRYAVALILCPVLASADAMVVNRVIRAGDRVVASDISIIKADIPRAMQPVTDFDQVEAKVTLYPGRPIRQGELGPQSIIKRNQSVAIEYLSGGLTIRVEGRAMGAASVGEQTRVQNIMSKTIVSGVVMPDGVIRIFSAEG